MPFWHLLLLVLKMFSAVTISLLLHPFFSCMTYHQSHFSFDTSSLKNCRIAHHLNNSVHKKIEIDELQNLNMNSFLFHGIETTRCHYIAEFGLYYASEAEIVSVWVTNKTTISNLCQIPKIIGK